MMRFFLALLLLALCQSSLAAYSFSAKASTDSGTSVTTSSATSSGNFCAMQITVRASATVSSVSDSKSNTWTQLGTVHLVNSVSNGYVYYAENATTGATHTFTVNISTTGTAHLAVVCLSDRATSSAVEASGWAADASSTTSHSGPSTGAYTAGSDVLAGLYDDNFDIHGQNMTWTAGSGWTLAPNGYNSDGRNHPTGGWEYIDNGAGTTVTAQYTTTTANIAGMFIFAVKASGGGGSTAVPVFLHHYQQMSKP